MPLQPPDAGRLACALAGGTGKGPAAATLPPALPPASPLPSAPSPSAPGRAGGCRERGWHGRDEMPPAIPPCAQAPGAKVTLPSPRPLPAAGTVCSGILLVAARGGDAGEGTWGVPSPRERGHSGALLFPRARRLLRCCPVPWRGPSRCTYFPPGTGLGAVPTSPEAPHHPHLPQTVPSSSGRHKHMKDSCPDLLLPETAARTRRHQLFKR